MTIDFYECEKIPVKELISINKNKLNFIAFDSDGEPAVSNACKKVFRWERLVK